jgi:hypothetical protein
MGLGVRPFADLLGQEAVASFIIATRAAMPGNQLL